MALNVSKLPNCVAKLHSCSMNKLHYLAKHNAWLLYTSGVSRKSKIYDMIGKKIFTSHMSHVTYHMSHVTCHISLVTCTCQAFDYTPSVSKNPKILDMI